MREKENRCRPHRLFHVGVRTSAAVKWTKMTIAHAKRAKVLFFIIKYANVWLFWYSRRPACLSSLLFWSEAIATHILWAKRTSCNRPLQLTITWYKIRHAGGQFHYYSRTGKVKSSFTGSGLFVLMSQCGNNNKLALQHGGFCTTWSLVARGLLISQRSRVFFSSREIRADEGLTLERST